MAIINQNELFDSLKRYIDVKTVNLSANLEEILIENKTKEIAENIDSINIVAGIGDGAGLIAEDLLKGKGTNQPTDSAILNALDNAIKADTEADRSISGALMAMQQVTLTQMHAGYASDDADDAEGFRDEAEVFKNEAQAAANPIPTGGIMLWSGTIANIPASWYLCDGTNGTPDLSDKFVMGTTTEAQVGDTGGDKDAVVVEHNHTGSTSTDGDHTHTVDTYNNGSIDNNIIRNNINSAVYTEPTSSAGDHSHTLTIANSGVSGTDKNLPPYYKLAYIMKGA